MRQRQLRNVEELLHRPREPYGAIGVRALSPMIGAEIEGVDLRDHPSDDEVAELRRALLEHHVLVFRDHALDDDLHRRTASLFGRAPEPGRPHLTIASEDSGASEPLMLAETWRADETFRRAPPAAGMLHVSRSPRLGAGGDVLFSNMQLAYELLSEPLKVLLTDLTAVHRRDPRAGDAADDNASARHPMVVRHPVTGVPALFVNRAHTSHIVELDPDHSEATLDMLYRHLEAQPVITCRVRLTPDTVVVWDNFAVQHLTLQDFNPRCLSGHVVWMAGGRPERWDG